jgi:hypothetical protein
MQTSLSILSSCSEKVHDDNEQQLKFYDGFENQTIIDFYLDYINDVEQMTNSKEIFIDYATYDLNDDELNDYLVFISSPLHSGSHGDTFHVLLNKGDGSYDIIASLTVPMYDQTDRRNPVVFVSSEKTNAYYDIILHQIDSLVILNYYNGGYIVQNS